MWRLRELYEKNGCWSSLKNILHIVNEERFEVNVIESITLSIAVLGALLGIINTWISVNRDKPKIKVIPQWAFIMPAGYQGISIEAMNIGIVPVTVCEVGLFLISKNQKLIDPRMNSLDGRDLPVRPESRSSISLLLSSEVLKDANFERVSHAYARTQCGITVRGKSITLKQIVRGIRKNQKEK